MVVRVLWGALLALTAARGVVGAPATTTTSLKCAANNCLRAIRATNSPTRQADCATYLLATVTPTTVTHTQTASYYSTSTEIDTITTISTLELTSTETHHATQTETVIMTSTEVVTDTSVSVIPTIATLFFSTTVTKTNADYVQTISIPSDDRASGAAAAPAIRRDVIPTPITVTPSIMPTYASACNGFAAYVSACACVGYVGSTTTVPAPSTTVTVSTTVISTYTSSRESTSYSFVTATSTITVTDIAVIVTSTTTVTSHTLSVLQTTKTVAIVSSTITSTATISVATATATVIVPFKIQVTSPDTLANQWIQTPNDNHAIYNDGLTGFVSDEASASVFGIRDGYLVTGENFWVTASYDAVSQRSYISYVLTANPALVQDATICTIDNSVPTLDCVGKQTGYSVFSAGNYITRSGKVLYFGTPDSATSDGYFPISFKLYPA
ncbi:hypothetical protein AA313_de0206029 [Arthrobotrys entomopaga]|nr:hypothetical protein AA313_de0206029 [Arthrobotrys entomopaga]